MDIQGKKVLITGDMDLLAVHLIEGLVYRDCDVRTFVFITLLIAGVGLIRFQLNNKSNWMYLPGT